MKVSKPPPVLKVGPMEPVTWLPFEIKAAEADRVDFIRTRREGHANRMANVKVETTRTKGVGHY